MKDVLAVLRRLFARSSQRTLDPSYLEQQRLFREAEERQRRIESLLFWKMKDDILKLEGPHENRRHRH